MWLRLVWLRGWMGMSLARDEALEEIRQRCLQLAPAPAWDR
jgi:hypothetical protein